MRNGNDCAETIVFIITTSIAILVSFFSSFVSTDSQISPENYPFVLAERGVSYTFIETLNCQFVIAGNIEYLDEEMINNENLLILVQPLGTYDARPAAIVDIGTDTRFGESGWSQLLVGNYWYTVSIHDLASGAALSEEVLVDSLNCENEHTLALVNFRQVLPLK